METAPVWFGPEPTPRYQLSELWLPRIEPRRGARGHWYIVGRNPRDEFAALAIPLEADNPDNPPSGRDIAAMQHHCLRFPERATLVFAECRCAAEMQWQLWRKNGNG